MKTMPTMSALVFFSVLGLGPSALAEVFLGPVTNNANGHTYYLLAPTNWTSAEAEAITLGGHLATIRSAAENAWITQTFAATNGDVWIGYRRVGAGFVWASGDVTTYVNWRVGEPNSPPDSEEFVLLYSPLTVDRPPPGSWNDAPDSYIQYAVVEVPQCVPPPSGLVGWWTGDGSANDIFGANNGTLQNGATFAPGKVGQAFLLDGRDDYVLIPNSPALCTNESFTVEFWFSPTTTINTGDPASYIFFSKGDNDSIGTENGSSRLEVRGPLPRLYSTNSTWYSNTWYYVALTYTSATYRLYVDGQEQTNVASAHSILDNTADIHLGHLPFWDAFFKGRLDEVSIYNRALSSNEVAAIYAAGSAGKCKPEPACVSPPSGLIGWWPGDGNANEIIGANNGTLLSGATFAPGLVGQAFSFTGDLSRVSVPNNDAFNFRENQDFSIALWLNLQNPQAGRYDELVTKLNIQGNRDATDPRGYYSWLVPDTHKVFIGLALGPNQQDIFNFLTDYAPPLNTWTHLAITRRGSLVSLFANGALVGATNLTSGSLVNSAPLVIGGDYDPAFGGQQSQNNFSGLLDEVSIFNRALTANEVAAIYAASAAGMCKPSCTPLPADSVGWWKAENNGSDSAGNNQGTILPGGAFAPGKVGLAFNFSGNVPGSSNGLVVIPDSAALRFGTDDLTIESWIKVPPGAIQNGPTFVGKGSWSYPSQSIFFRVRDEDGRLAFAVADCTTPACGWGTSRQAVISPGRIDDGLWHHVAGVRTATNYQLYLDGQLVATRDEPARNADTADPLLIGAALVPRSDPPHNGYAFTGLVDELAIYRRALSSNEIAAIYAAGNAGKCDETTSAGFLYWSTIAGQASSAIKRSRPDGTGIETLPLQPASGRFGGIAFDVANGHLYSGDGSTLFRANLDGTGRTNLITGFLVTDIELDLVHGKVYWSTGGQIRRANLDGTQNEILIGNLGFCEGFAVDPIGGRIYYADGRIKSGGLDGSNIIDFAVLSSASGPFDVEFDSRLNRVYWNEYAQANISNQKIRWANADGSGSIQTVLAPPPDGLSNGMHFDSVDQRVYFSSHQSPSSIQQCNPDGSGLETVLTETNAPAVNYCEVVHTSFTTSLPDLAVTALTAPPNVLAGQPVQIVWSVSNQGAATAVGPWIDIISLATNSSGGGSQQIASFPFTNSLFPGASITRTGSVIMPTSFAGQKYLVVTTDAANQISETSKANNAAVTLQSIHILAPDLIVESVTAASSAQFGQTIQVTWVVHNAGTAPASANWSDRVYLSASGSSLNGADVLLTVPAVGTLAAGASYTNSQSISLPLDTTRPPGSYFLVVAADYSGVQPESNDGNNLGFRPITFTNPPLPDLAVMNVTVPATALPGQILPFSWTLTNSGSAAAEGAWMEAVSLSPDGVAGNDRLLASFIFTNTISAGGFLTRTQQIQVPITGVRGDLFVVVQADAQNSILEANEANNFAVSTSTMNVPTALTLSLAVTQIAENASNPNIQATVNRNGDISGPLAVTITTSDANKLTTPDTVTILAGQGSAAFNLTVRPNGIADSDKLVTVTASAAGFIGSTGLVTVINTDLPRLSLAVNPPTIVEGSIATVTVTRDNVTAQSLTVTLVSSSPGNLVVPGFAIIPANSNSTSFAVLAMDDTVVEQLRTFTITASAGGYANVAGDVSIADNDLPLITLELASTNVSEGAGPQATTGTIRRNIANGDVVVALRSSDTTAAVVPPTVRLAAGQLEITFPVGAVDNFIVDGPRTNIISAFVVDSVAGQPLGSTVTQTLIVTDDDGPTLRLSIARKVVPEGGNPATTATIRRNTSTNTALVVSLRSSDTNEATVSATVTIPAGQSTASFDIATIDDGVTDGNKLVTITATATGHVDGIDTLLVSDTNLPDLLVTDITMPGSVNTEASFSITYRIANQGLVPANTNFLTRIYLTTDPVAGKPVLIGEQSFEATLPAGQFFERTLQAVAPLAAGQYWVLVQTDVSNAVAEILENNNFKIMSGSISVQPAYRATVQTDTQNALPGTPITLRGQALRSGSNDPASDVAVNLHTLIAGTDRIISTRTDANGNFVATFTPLPGEAGAFTVIAAHPGESNPTNNGVSNTVVFAVLGMKLDIPNAYQTLVEHEPWLGRFTLRNLANVPLTGLRAEVVQKPDNITVSSLTLEQGAALLANGTNTLAVQLVAQNAANPIGELVVRLTSDQGVTAEGHVLLSITRERAQLAAQVSTLEASMVRGKTRTVDFKVSNFGAAATGPVMLLLPPVPWLASPLGQTLPSIAPGQTETVSLTLNPAPDLPLTVAQGSLVLIAETAQLTLPFAFRCVSDATADLAVTAVDEFYFYGVGSPKLSNALVRLLDPFTSQEIVRDITGTNGVVSFSTLNEGPYTLEVSANNHTSYRNTVVLEAGVLNEQQAFLSRQVVTYRWTVEEVPIEERVIIHVEAVFEANVPIPVIVVTPTLIDLSPLTTPGQAMQVDVKIANHGLIAWRGVNISFQDHPTYELKPLIEDVGIITAQSEVIVPVVARFKGPLPFAASTAQIQSLTVAPPLPAPPPPGSCNVYGQVIGYYPCGGQNVSSATALQGYANCLPTAPPLQPSQSSNTPPSPPNPGGGSGGGGSGGGSSGGVGPSASWAPIQISQQPNCNCNPPRPNPCPSIPASTTCVTWMVDDPGDACHCATFRPIYTANSCDDLNDCTLDDKCESGTCQGTPVQISFGGNMANGVCAGGSAQVNVNITPPSARGMVTFVSADPSVATVSGGYPTLTLTAMSDAGGKSTAILAKINGTVCSSGGVTVATDACDDGNPCTINDRCVNGVCIGTPVQNGQPCDDGDPCTENDQCINGVCQGTPIPNCTPCDDGDPCTVNDRMINGVCQGTPIPNCSPCDDGNPCTYNDRMVNGVCQGTLIPNCSPCDDGNPCTTNDRLVNGGCYGTPIPNCTPCDDGDPCTVDDRLVNGVCSGTALQSVTAKANGQDTVTVYVRQPVSFTATTTPANFSGVQFDWGFGDGTNAQGASVVHSYLATGDYQAQITARCGNGTGPVVSDTVAVHVIAPPLPPIEADIIDEAGNAFASGVHASSIKLTVNGVQVFPSITPISGGFHIYYVPSAAQVPNPNNEVQLEASDKAVGDGTVGNTVSETWNYPRPSI